MSEKQELATFAGGCFWCMVKPFLMNSRALSKLNQGILADIQ